MDYNRIVDESKLQHHFVEAAGLKWHYVEMGQGEPVVLLHGIPEAFDSSSAIGNPHLAYAGAIGTAVTWGR
jgi:pimeloyl-ACP methyl ester carboxylesterase